MNVGLVHIPDVAVVADCAAAAAACCEPIASLPSMLRSDICSLLCTGGTRAIEPGNLLTSCFISANSSSNCPNTTRTIEIVGVSNELSTYKITELHNIIDKIDIGAISRPRLVWRCGIIWKIQIKNTKTDKPGEIIV